MMYFLSALCGSLCCYFSFFFLMPNKFMRYQKALIFSFTFGVTFFLNAHIGQFVAYLTVFGSVLLIAWFSKADFYSLSCALWGYLYTVTCNYLLIWLLVTILGIDERTLITKEILNAVFVIFFCIFCGITTKLLGNFLNKRLQLYQRITGTHTLFGTFLFLLLLVLFFVFQVAYGDHIGYTYGVTAFSGIIFLLLFVVAVYLMHNIYRHTQQEEQEKSRMAQSENLLAYTKKLEESYALLRSFRHDYMNILTTMSGFMEENDIVGLKDYYESKILPLNRGLTESNYRLNELGNIQNTALKSLISSKLIYAMERGIEIELEIREPLEEFHMDTLDFSRIIGIFLDNAVEAALETKQRILRFGMWKQETGLTVIIQNTALPLLLPISQLKAFGVSKKGDHRGIGLYSASELISHHPGAVWDMTYQEPFFTQKLTVYSRGDKKI